MRNSDYLKDLYHKLKREVQVKKNKTIVVSRNTRKDRICAKIPEKLYLERYESSEVNRDHSN